MNDFKIVAIDGGAASGKSSTAKRLCVDLNYMHVDTGAHYRAMTYLCLENGIGSCEIQAINQFLSGVGFESSIRGHSSFISFNGSVLGVAELRSEKVNKNVSAFAAIPQVRDKVKTYQRRQVDVAKEAGFKGLIMDGRDIGTVIFPQADLKVFLYADEITRSLRRVNDGQVDQIGDRDRIDSKRKTAPLVPARDARRLDNSTLGLDEVVALIKSWIFEL